MNSPGKIILVITAIIAMVAGFLFSSSLDNSGQTAHTVPSIQGMVLPEPRKISVPELIRDDGQPFTNADLSGHWTLVFFGYTHCPDICPTTMNVLAQARKKATGEFPEVVFVSIDPLRDTVELLNKYVKYFDKDFTGVTGDEKMIEALTLQTSVVYMKVPGNTGDDKDYLMDHSSSLLLVNPEGRLAAFLKAPHTTESILESVEKVISSQS